MQLAYEAEAGAAATPSARVRAFQAVLLLPDAELDAFSRALVSALLQRMPDGRRCALLLAGSERRCKNWKELSDSCGGRLRRVSTRVADLADDGQLTAALAEGLVAVNVCGAVAPERLPRDKVVEADPGGALGALAEACLAEAARFEQLATGAEAVAVVDGLAAAAGGLPRYLRALGEWARPAAAAAAAPPLPPRIARVFAARVPPPKRNCARVRVVVGGCECATASTASAGELAGRAAAHKVFGHLQQPPGAGEPFLPGAPLVHAGCAAVALRPVSALHVMWGVSVVVLVVSLWWL